jgi:hypothetical protein
MAAADRRRKTVEIFIIPSIRKKMSRSGVVISNRNMDEAYAGADYQGQ